MKPDAGKSRDKERLADKKAKKAAAKEQRKADAAPASAQALAELEAHLKTRRGQNRKSAFRELHKLDRDRAVAVVTALAGDADGKNKAELGALLCSTAEDRFVDACAAGRFGDVAVWEHAPGALAGALERLRLSLPQLAIDDVTRRLRALGVLPLQDATRALRGLAPLVEQLLDDDRFGASPAGSSTDLAALRVALLELDPFAAWRRRRTDTADDNAIAVIAGLACGQIGGAAHAAVDAVDVDGFVAWLRQQPPRERARWMAVARLPASVVHLAAHQAIPLLGAVLLDDVTVGAHAATAARELWTIGGDAVIDVVLSRPAANPAVTAAACARLEFEEAWSVADPLFRNDRAFRDVWLGSRHAGHAALIDVVVPMLVTDPIGAAAYLACSDEPRGRQELLRACEVADAGELHLLLGAVLARSLSASVRNEIEHETLERLVRAAPREAERRPIAAPLVVDVLETVRARNEARAASLDAALDGAIRSARELLKEPDGRR